MVVMPGYYEDRKYKMSKPAKPVAEERSPPSKGNRADANKGKAAEGNS